MTIYTPSQTEKKPEKDCEDPEVVTEPLVDPEDEHATTMTVKAMRVSYFQRSQRSFFLHLLITLMVLVILTFGAIGAVIFYRHLNKRVYTGRCGNVFYDRTFPNDPNVLLRDPAVAEMKSEHFVEESIIVSDIDMYEQLYTPQFAGVRESHVWHDFVRNYTAIVDNTWHICYLMKLNRTAIAPPRDVIDFLNKAANGYYVPSVDIFRENYIVIPQPLTDLAPFGQKVVDNCIRYDTYWLDKFPCPSCGVVKRSVDAPEEPTVTYAMFSNHVNHQELIKVIIHKALMGKEESDQEHLA